MGFGIWRTTLRTFIVPVRALAEQQLPQRTQRNNHPYRVVHRLVPLGSVMPITAKTLSGFLVFRWLRSVCTKVGSALCPSAVSGFNVNRKISVDVGWLLLARHLLHTARDGCQNLVRLPE